MTFKNLRLPMFASSVLVISLTCAAEAAPIVTATIGGAPGGSILDNLDQLALGLGGGVTATGIMVSFAGGGGVVNGSSGGVYAAPDLSGSNGTGLGSPNQADGIDTTNYITAGGDSSSYALLQFPMQLSSVGFLWGSIDTYNTLELLENGSVIGTVTGSDAAAAASTLPNGDQTVDGTAYVNIYSSVAFNEIEALSTSPAFEFDNVSYSAAPPAAVPEPITLSLFGVGVASAAALRRRKKKESV